LSIIIIVLITTAVITAVVYFSIFFKQNISVYENNILEKPQIKVLFVGDLMFDRGIRYFAEKNSGNEFIFKKIENLLLKNNLVIANLEGPITENMSVSYGTIPESPNNYIFTFEPNLANTLFNENIRIVNLGNNHILNFRQKGVLSTKNYLDKANVDYFGEPGGSRSISTEILGTKITFISYNEFSAIPNEPDSVVDEIQKAKKFSDIIIIYCHWGIEYKNKASAQQIELAHKFIDRGADVVIGSHPHVIQNSEEYKEKKIYYSLGNFIFDQYFNENVRNGLGVRLNINPENKQISFEEFNFYLNSNGQTVLK
jgi:poly-gamma-glutamate synthesis protein (capsule biosynthesis protein)